MYRGEGPGAADLTAAGITGPGLRAAYLRCRALHATHGRTYFLATRLLRPARRPAVHALYGFARLVDEIVDDLADRRSAADRAAEVDRLGRALDTALDTALDAPDPTRAGDPVLAAVADTARRYAIPRRHFADFLASMRMDTHRTDYPTYADLARYVHGSAAVIGLQLVPVLGTVVDRATAEPPAAALGVAFQLTNFLRDVGEDLDRGRVYLPADELAAFGVDRELLGWCRRRRRADPRVRRALAFQTARTRAVYRRAEPGVAMLVAESRPCIRVALRLYAGILDEIEAVDHDVLWRRVAVPHRRRLAVVLPGAARALAARARGGLRSPWPARGA